jgi:hypothetical protein
MGYSYGHLLLQEQAFFIVYDIIVVLDEGLLDFIQLNALVLHVVVVLVESFEYEDDEVGQTVDLHIVVVLEFIDHVVQFNAVGWQELFPDLFESHLGGLLGFYLLEGALLADEQSIRRGAAV